MKIRLLLIAFIFAIFISLPACFGDMNSESLNYTFEISETEWKTDNDFDKEITTYILNVKSKKIHKVTCGTGDLMLPENRRAFEGDIEDLFDQGYTRCGNCFRQQSD